MMAPVTLRSVDSGTDFKKNWFARFQYSVPYGMPVS